MHSFKFVSAAAVSSIAFASTAVTAQEADSHQESVDEVVVTATRMGKSARGLPIKWVTTP